MPSPGVGQGGNVLGLMGWICPFLARDGGENCFFTVFFGG